MVIHVISIVYEFLCVVKIYCLERRFRVDLSRLHMTSLSSHNRDSDNYHQVPKQMEPFRCFDKYIVRLTVEYINPFCKQLVLRHRACTSYIKKPHPTHTSQHLVYLHTQSGLLRVLFNDNKHDHRPACGANRTHGPKNRYRKFHVAACRARSATEHNAILPLVCRVCARTVHDTFLCSSVHTLHPHTHTHKH